MAVYIHPGKVSGIVTVPSSKSLSHRVLIASLLCEEECVISNLCICDDVTATLEIIKSLGKEVTVVNGNYYIKPANGISNYVLNANESGSTLRFLIPIVSLYNNEFIFKGSKKLLSRPLDVYKKIYDSQSLKFELNEDYLKVSGKLSSGVYEIPGNISSQFITGLLFTLPLLDGDSCIKIIGKLESISYVDMTIDILNKFGVKVDFKDNEIFIPGNQKYSKYDYNVPGDYSQMAFWAVLGTINNDIEIKGMTQDKLQGDSEIVEILKNCSGNIEYIGNSYIVRKKDFNKINVDLSMIPDLGPILAVLASCGEEVSFINNCIRLKYKESDRLNAIYEELIKMSVDVNVVGNSLIIKGSKDIYNKNIIDSHNDHRIFMALAVLGTISKNGVRINNEKCISKSYPNFLNDLQKLGVKVDYE